MIKVIWLYIEQLKKLKNVSIGQVMRQILKVGSGNANNVRNVTTLAQPQPRAPLGLIKCGYPFDVISWDIMVLCQHLQKETSTSWL